MVGKRKFVKFVVRDKVGKPLVKVEVEGVLIEEHSDSIWRGSTPMNRSGERSGGLGSFRLL